MKVVVCLIKKMVSIYHSLQLLPVRYTQATSAHFRLPPQSLKASFWDIPHTIFNKMQPSWILTSSLYYLQPLHSPTPHHSSSASIFWASPKFLSHLQPPPMYHLVPSTLYQFKKCNLSPYLPTPTLCPFSLLHKHYPLSHTSASLSTSDCYSHFHCLPDGSCSPPTGQESPAHTRSLSPALTSPVFGFHFCCEGNIFFLRPQSSPTFTLISLYYLSTSLHLK